jgi:hypothetical protein
MNLSNPWSLQIALLPVRRVTPDEKRDQAQAEKRAAAGRASGIKTAAERAKQNKARALKLFKPGIEWSTPQVAEKLKLPLETARVALNKLEGDRLLQCRPSGRTKLFSLRKNATS